jgi:hypothetical protein
LKPSSPTFKKAVCFWSDFSTGFDIATLSPTWLARATVDNATLNATAVARVRLIRLMTHLRSFWTHLTEHPQSTDHSAASSSSTGLSGTTVI